MLATPGGSVDVVPGSFVPGDLVAGGELVPGASESGRVENLLKDDSCYKTSTIACMYAN